MRCCRPATPRGRVRPWTGWRRPRRRNQNPRFAWRRRRRTRRIVVTARSRCSGRRRNACDRNPFRPGPWSRRHRVPQGPYVDPSGAGLLPLRDGIPCRAALLACSSHVAQQGGCVADGEPVVPVVGRWRWCARSFQVAVQGKPAKSTGRPSGVLCESSRSMAEGCRGRDRRQTERRR